jgi:hypothetical protein
MDDRDDDNSISTTWRLSSLFHMLRRFCMIERTAGGPIRSLGPQLDSFKLRLSDV